jgi:hypothetical protein
LKRELLAPPRLTGWIPFPTRAPQFIACIPRFFFSIFESELNHVLNLRCQCEMKACCHWRSTSVNPSLAPT